MAKARQCESLFDIRKEVFFSHFGLVRKPLASNVIEFVPIMAFDTRFGGGNIIEERFLTQAITPKHHKSHPRHSLPYRHPPILAVGAINRTFTHS